MARPSKSSQNFPPFPPLKWDESLWEGQALLPSWGGFQARQGAYGAVSSRRASDGTVRLDVLPPAGPERPPPTPEQAAAFRFLMENEAAVHAAVLGAIFKAYPELRESYDYDDEEAEELMPAVGAPEQLKALIGLSTVHVLPVSQDGVAYVGFEFGCTWDDEHGLGVMTHRERVVEVGGADTSLLEWVAEEDAKRHKRKKRDSGRA